MGGRYETDFYAWTEEQAGALRRGELAALDVANLVEELQSMGARERGEMVSRLTELLLHLLKWRYQPGLRGASWEISIAKQRDGLADLFERSPSLRPRLAEAFDKAYPRARRYAAKETGLPLATFPEACPFDPADVLADTYLPH